MTIIQLNLPPLDECRRSAHRVDGAVGNQSQQPHHPPVIMFNNGAQILVFVLARGYRQTFGAEGGPPILHVSIFGPFAV